MKTKQSRYNKIYKPECIQCGIEIPSPKDSVYLCEEHKVDKDYYINQINKAGFENVKIKLVGESGESNFLNLNRQSISLLENYLIELGDKLTK